MDADRAARCAAFAAALTVALPQSAAPEPPNSAVSAAPAPHRVESCKSPSVEYGLKLKAWQSGKALKQLDVPDGYHMPTSIPDSPGQGNSGIGAVPVRSVEFFRQDGLIFYFDTSSDETAPAANQMFQRAFDDIRDADPAYVLLIGRTDSTGQEVFNEALALARASHVANRLIEMGLNRNAFCIQGVIVKSVTKNGFTNESDGNLRRVDVYFAAR